MREQATQIAQRLQEHPSIGHNEAQTKNSLIEPFLQCLGYDPSHPEQVTLELPTELGGKIDYVLTSSEKIKIAVEAKKADTNLSQKETNQLRSYFTFSEAVAAILTNGIDYWLFTDSGKTNVMDSKPYHRVDVRNLSDNDIQHLEALVRGQVTQQAVHEQARWEQHRKLVNRIVAQELASPSQELLRLIGRKAGIKPLTKSNLQMLHPLVIEAISHNRGETTSTVPSKLSSPKPVEHEPVGKSPLTLEKAFLFGQELQVKTFRGILQSVVTEMMKRHTANEFSEVVCRPAFKGKKWWLISTNQSELSPKLDKVRIEKYWVNVNFSAREHMALSRKYLKEFGHDPDELVIHTDD